MLEGNRLLGEINADDFTIVSREDALHGKRWMRPDDVSIAWHVIVVVLELEAKEVRPPEVRLEGQEAVQVRPTEAVAVARTHDSAPRGDPRLPLKSFVLECFRHSGGRA